MFKYVRLGDKEAITPVEMPEATKTVLMEIFAQNRIILEANCLIMRLLGQPPLFLSRDSETQA